MYNRLPYTHTRDRLHFLSMFIYWFAYLFHLPHMLCSAPVFAACLSLGLYYASDACETGLLQGESVLM